MEPFWGIVVVATIEGIVLVIIGLKRLSEYSRHNRPLHVVGYVQLIQKIHGILFLQEGNTMHGLCITEEGSSQEAFAEMSQEELIEILESQAHVITIAK